MTDLFRIIPYVVRSAGTDVPPEEVQAAINSLAQQTTIGLNSVASDPTGPASGDLGGMYPAPTVVAVHAVGGTLDGVVIGGTTPAAGSFTTLAASTPVAVTSGGTGSNALNAHNVLIGEGSSAVGFAAPGTAGRMLISTGATTDPAFANNPVITGGTIDNAPIGQTTPAAGNFTTLAASTAITVPSGGTGRGTLTTHGVLIGEGTSAINQTVAGTTGQMLLGVTGADPAFGNNPTITGGTVDGATVGATTPSTGAFTTLSASSGLNNTAVGNTTSSTGAFTTLSSTGNFTPSQTNGIVGTTTNNNANAGSVGEFISSTVLVGSAVPLTSGVSANVTSISLTAGDWDVWGNIVTNPAGTTTQANTIGAISTTSATLPTPPNGGSGITLPLAIAAGIAIQLPVGVTRISIASTTTVFLVISSSFATSTNAGYGFIGARRRR